MEITNLPGTIEELRSYFVTHPEHKPKVPEGPGLGLGNRMGFLTSISAMIAIQKLRIEASAIQGSVFRELKPDYLEDNELYVDYKGIGKVPIGHTGMSIYGEFLGSIQERIRKNITVPYVADADHIPILGISEDNIQNCRKIVRESQDRTLFTLDAHFCIDSTTKRPEAKYDLMLTAIEKVKHLIDEIKDTSPYALEISIDESADLTTLEDLKYIIKRISKSPVAQNLFSIAPSIGFTKKDEDMPEFAKTLKRMLPPLNSILADNGLITGIHSGDNKSNATLQVIGESTQSNVWYKVSPDRQRMFFKILEKTLISSEKKLFNLIWNDLLSIAQNGINSSDKVFSQNCQKCLDEADLYSRKPKTDTSLFFNFGFLLMRKYGVELRSLSKEFHDRYIENDFDYIKNLALNLGIT